MCEILSQAGFFSGLWAGMVAIFSLIGDMFFEVAVYNKCQQSWWYDLGFIIGLVFIGVYAIRISPVVILIVFIFFLIVTVFNLIVWGGAIAVGIIAALCLYLWWRGDRGLPFA